MTTTIALYPTPQQIQTLLSGPPDQPVVMVNLLRFKRIADPPNDAVSGEDAYRRYAEKMIAFVKSKGGRVIWSGRVDSQVIGDGGDLELPRFRELLSRSGLLAQAVRCPRNRGNSTSMQPFDHLIDLSSGVSGDVRLQLLDDVGSTNLQDAIQGVDHL